MSKPTKAQYAEAYTAERNSNMLLEERLAHGLDAFRNGFSVFLVHKFLSYPKLYAWRLGCLKR